ncbi:acyl-CoA/acyl-ACP dehydrogenase [Microbacterium sp. LWH7-1.2]|uniref:acyl-CoA dehydrogenase family protein n=1 Tax=Microbacterium sp. LWH7-1.2 TaxID=3135257 RepID=UPI003138BE87
MLDFDDSIYLDEDLLAIREAITELCARFPMQYWIDKDTAGTYPEEFVDALQEGGWLSVLIPEEYGGGGMGVRAAAVILETINRCGGSANQVHAQMYTMTMVVRHGSEELKQRLLPRIASGELRMQAFGLTEPDAGSDTTKMRTRAVRDGDHYVLNGGKIYSSRFFHSDIYLVMARTTPLEDVQKKIDGISAFVVDIKDAGDALRATAIDTMLNHETAQVFIDNLRIPAENLIGEEGKGYRYLMSGLNAERIIVASEHVGSAFWFLDRATEYANERVVFDRPIGQNQGVQFPLAKAYLDTSAASLFRWHAAALFDTGAQAGFEATAAKYLSSQAQWAAANAAMDTFGGAGLTTEYGIERKFREARLSMVAPVSNNLVLSYVATQQLQLPRSY